MKARALLSYYPNGTQFSRTPSRLTWTDDDRLVLERVDESGAATEVFFDVPVTEVQVRGAMSVPKFVVAGKGYRVDFAEAARIAGGLAGLAGGAFGSAMVTGAQAGVYAGGTAVSGVHEFMAGLKRAGARSRYWTTTGVVVGTLASVFGFFAVGTVVVAIVQALIR